MHIQVPPPFGSPSKNRAHSLFFNALIALSLTISAASADTITLDGNDTGKAFDGIGALSAGASSRLLIDYPEKQRSEILDYLFKPNFGAALQINKVEIGGDMNSTDGAEPSHMRTPTDENYQRGYEWWLMEESKKRNPDVKLYGLEWGAPNWINPTAENVWTQANITYILKWVEHAKSDHRLTIDYLGGWNEKGFDKPWYEQFRTALHQAGYENIKIVADDSFKWIVGKTASEDPKFASSFDIIGMHYPDIPSATQNWKLSRGTKKPLWASEMGSGNYDAGAARLAKVYNQGYVDDGMTSYINWSTIWSVLAGQPYSGNGLMLADQPWSGHYVIGLSIWATAHTTQFTQPGWQYLDRACGHFGGKPKTGTYVALRSPDHRDFSLIAETVDAREPQTLHCAVTGGLSSRVLHVWRTNLRSKDQSQWFAKQPDVTPQNGDFTITCAPGCIYSVTTTSGQCKGTTDIPAATPLPLPFRDNFQQYAIGATPRLFSDQHGAFEEAQASGGRHGKCLRQVVTAKPIAWNCDSDPGTLIGDPSWKNCRIAIDALLEHPGYVDLVGRVTASMYQNRIHGYHLHLTSQGHWSLFVRNNDSNASQRILASGEIPSAAGPGHWHNLSLSFAGKNIAAAIDGKTVVTGVADTTYASGLVGIEANRWQTAEFMNFEAVSINGTYN